MVRLALLALALLAFLPTARAAEWRELAPGLAYRQLEAPGALFGLPWKLHAFRVDLTRWRPELLDARKPGRVSARIDTLAREAGAALAVNGSFFDEAERPLGLLVGGGREVAPLRKADWGVLYFTEGGAAPKGGLVHTREWPPKLPKDARVVTALQVGPRLVVDGEPLTLKEQTARRAAVGLRPDGQVVVVVSGTVPLESNLLARIFHAPEGQGGLGCRFALMMDGGPSAQLHAAVGELTLTVPGGTPVPVGLGFVPR